MADAAEHVLEELRLLAPHLARDSIVLMHDTALAAISHDSENMSDTPVPHMLNYREFDYLPHDEWPKLAKKLKGEFADGGPYGALLQLPSESWEWATVPRCHGMTMLRKKDAKFATCVMVDAGGIYPYRCRHVTSTLSSSI